VFNPLQVVRIVKADALQRRPACELTRSVTLRTDLGNDCGVVGAGARCRAPIGVIVSSTLERSWRDFTVEGEPIVPRQAVPLRD
jgi:hypothetical protein